MANLDFGREICGVLAAAERREWLVTNGTGSYASGTVAGIATRGYHGLLVAALQPPVGRTVLVGKLDEIVTYGGQQYQLATNRWADGSVSPQGYRHIERFTLQGTVPLWRFALADAILEKTVWMERGQDATYVQYSLKRATMPLSLSFRALVNYRDYHSRTHANGRVMQVDAVPDGMRVSAYAGARTFFLLADSGQATVINQWDLGVELAAEKDRGLDDVEDVLCAGSFQTTLNVGESVTFVASLSSTVDLNGTAARNRHEAYEQQLYTSWKAVSPPGKRCRTRMGATTGSGGRPIHRRSQYRPGAGEERYCRLPLVRGLGKGHNDQPARPESCNWPHGYSAQNSEDFAQFLDRGMIPNHFPDDGSRPAEDHYNTVDASLWYFEAIRQYIEATADNATLGQLFPVLQQIIDTHEHGTRFNIHLDSNDGLLVHVGIGPDTGVLFRPLNLTVGCGWMWLALRIRVRPNELLLATFLF
jgi:glycogen debranching enzyme